MRIHVEGDYFISGEGMSYQLEKKTVTQKGDNAGKENFTALGYYSSVAGCAKALLKMKISESSATTLHELIKDVDRIEEYLKVKINF